MTDDRYVREVDSNKNDSTSWIVNTTTSGATVLDVGCGPGTIGKFLIAEKSCSVDGIELSDDFCNRARGHYRNVWQGDLEKIDLASTVEGNCYDFIVCADVLEHLRDPKVILKQLASCLKPDGRILISIPNVSYAGLLAELLYGRFDYRPNGLLDDTHVRFFTRATLVELLTDSGIKINELQGIVMKLEDSEFGIDRMHVLGPSLFNMILQRPDALTYQFVIDCVSGSTESNNAFANAEVQIESFKAAEGFGESLLALKQQILSLESQIQARDKQIVDLEKTAQTQNAEVETRGAELDKKRRDLAQVRSELEAIRTNLLQATTELSTKEAQLKEQASQIEGLRRSAEEQQNSPASRLVRTIRSLQNRP